jgi:hypothetical protein
MMNDTPNQALPARGPMTPQKVGDVVWDSAVEALSSAFIVWILGGVALSIAGGFAKGMIPSPPPSFGGEGETALGRGWFGEDWVHPVKGHVFVFLFSVFFAHSLWTAFRRRDSGKVETGAFKRVGFMLAKLRADWFGLIVTNAIEAWVGAMVLVWASGFSMTQMFWHWLAGLIFSGPQGLGEAALGHAAWSRIEPWLSWYGANQMKLDFWFLYFAGICDDLGLPNIKALGRWGWRRWKRCPKRNEPSNPQPSKDATGESPKEGF